MENLTRELKKSGEIFRSVDESKYAGAFIDDRFVKDAVEYEYDGFGSKIIRVACITGDIHHIVLHVGIDLGFFTEYGIDIKLTASLSNGAAVVDSLIGGQSDFGFVGAPPAILKSVNGDLIHV